MALWRDFLDEAATFGWLCVETCIFTSARIVIARQPPSGGCVLKLVAAACADIAAEAATFGWLCVETLRLIKPCSFRPCSHLRVAVC